MSSEVVCSEGYQSGTCIRTARSNPPVLTDSGQPQYNEAMLRTLSSRASADRECHMEMIAMHPDLQINRRVVINATQRYSRADADWHKGLIHAAEIFPDVVGHGFWHIGNPGSRIRKLYERREQALRRLDVARLKLQFAKKRLRDRHEASRANAIALFITHRPELI